MHFLLGWPYTLKLPALPPLKPTQSGQATGAEAAAAAASVVTEPIRSFATNQQRTKTAVVTDTAVYLFHFQQGESMCVGVWRRSPESLLAEGTNGCALFSPRDDRLAVATTRHVLNVLRIREISSSDGNGAHYAEVCSFPNAEWHDEATLNAPIFHPIHLELHSRVKLANDFVTCACTFGEDMLLGTRGGYIQVVSWDGSARICVDALACATSADAASPSPQPSSADITASSAASDSPLSPTPKPAIVQVSASIALGLVAFVFSDGSAGVCDTALLQPAATTGQISFAATSASGMLMAPSGRTSLEVDQATRTSFNERHRMLAVGVESGDVLVYRVEPHPLQQQHSSWTPAATPAYAAVAAAASSSSPLLPSAAAPGRLSFLHRYSISPWGFTSQDVGRVQCMEWSPDGSVLAVGWSGRGLVVWSTGGTRVACTLPMISPLVSLAAGVHGTAQQHFTATAAAGVPASAAASSYPPSTPSTLAPTSELLGNGVSALAWGCAGASLLVSGHCNELTHGFGSIKLKSKSWSDVSNDAQPAQSPSQQKPLLPSAEARCGCGLVTRLSFVRSCLASNPSQNERTSLVLLGEDRVVLWAGKRAIASSMSSSASSSSSMASSDETTDDLLQSNWVPAQSNENSDNDDEGIGGSSASASDRRAASDRHARVQANEDRFLDSDGDWEHIQLPAMYLRQSWPIRFCALSVSGLQMACAGSQGLILYNRASSLSSGGGVGIGSCGGGAGGPGGSGSAAPSALAPHQRKWRRFGNINHEEAVSPLGLAWFGEHVVCVASRGIQNSHHAQGRTSRWSPPPAAAAKRHPPSGNAAQAAAEDSIELLFYPRSHLDNSSLLHTHVLSNASSFHSLDISDDTLMIYLSIGQLLIYKLRAEVHLNPNSGRAKQPPPGSQAAMLAQLMQLAGSNNTNNAANNPSGAVPYSTAPHAHESLGIDHEIRMTMELAFVVDLCAPLAPVRSLSSPPSFQSQFESASLLATLATPPLQCRLWLTSADNLEHVDQSVPEEADPESDADAEQQQPPPPPPVVDSSSLVTDQVYELPLFCPNAQPQGLEALFQATTPNAAGHARRTSRAPPHTQSHSQTSKTSSSPPLTKVLSCIILTATGQLLAVDIGSTVRSPSSFYSPSVSTPSTPANSSVASIASSSAAGIQTMVAWVRLVSTEVEQFWLHEMAALDPMHTALKFLQDQRKRMDASMRGMVMSTSAATTTAIVSSSAASSASAVATTAVVAGALKRPVRGFRLFSYGRGGLDVWFRLSCGRSGGGGTSVPASFQSNTLLDFDPEVYPLGLDSSIGVIVGITKGLRTRSAHSGAMLPQQTPTTTRHERKLLSPEEEAEEPSPFWGPVVCFRLQTQLQPYLQGVLMHLVTNEHTALATTGPAAASSDALSTVVAAAPSLASRAHAAQLEYAFQIANSCRTHEYFSVSLELLLHLALHPSSSRGSGRGGGNGGGSSLQAVVHFLRRFPEFPDIVVNCARKNDASVWERLFAQAGDPLHLFDLCMNQGKLRMASCCLVVIQRTTGVIAAREAAMRILKHIEQEGNSIAVHATAASNGNGSSHSNAPSRPATPSSSSTSAADVDSLPLLAPRSLAALSLASSPSMTFHRRRRLSALEGELQRFIALSYSMEQEMKEQQEAAAAAAAGGAMDARKATPVTALPLVSPARRSQPTTPVLGATQPASTAAAAALPPLTALPSALAPPPTEDGGCIVS